MPLQFLGFLTLLNRRRTSFSLSNLYFFTKSPFSSIDFFENASDLEKPSRNLSKLHNRIDERFVLQELSKLLSIDTGITDSHLSLQNPDEKCIRIADLRPIDDEISFSQPVLGNSAERWAESSNLDGLVVRSFEKCLESSSDLVRIDSMNLNYNGFVEDAVRRGSDGIKADGFLLPAEKLRGIFLQKLKGKANVKSALSATGVDPTLEIFAEVVNRGNLGGEAMVLFFDWAVEQPKISKTLEIYHIILKALGRRKFFGFVEEILQRMKKEGLSINAETIFIVMDCFIRARRVTKAFEMFERLEEFGSKCDSESFNVLLKCLCRRSHIGTANSFLNKMRGKIQIDSTTYNVVIGGWAKLGRMCEVERNWKAMLVDGLEPDCVTFSLVIESLGRAGRIDDAVEVFNMMEEKGCIPDTVVYNAMICNFISVGDLNECVKYYEGMLRKNCAPDIDTCTKLINAFIKVRRVADALEMFDEMLHRGILPTIGTVTSFIEPLCSFGPPYAAMMIYKKAKKVGCGISLKAYKLLLMRLSRFGKCGMVLQVWEDMQDSGYSSDMEIYECIVNGLCNIGQLENAVLVMQEALDKGFCPSKLIYSKLNNKLLNANKVEMAYKLLLKVKKVRCSENARRYWRANGWHF
ncbi:hypothetical protein AAC387_Pa04g2066 [Persea americana]